jgi:hypothetical protein
MISHHEFGGAMSKAKTDAVSGEDIFIWPDHFWCFRNEFAPAFLRANDYRVVDVLTTEWSQLNRLGMRSTLT